MPVDPMVYLWRLIALGGLLVCSGFFSGSETALFSLSAGQLYRMRHGSASGRRVAALMDSPGRLLNILLLGNMLVNVSYAGICAVSVMELTRAGAEVWVTVVATLVPLLILILVGEVTPKILAITYAGRWACRTAWPTVIITTILSPIPWVLERILIRPLTRIIAPAPAAKTNITSSELAALMSLSAKRGVIGNDVNSLLQEIVELTALNVSDIMTPRVDMITYDADGAREGLEDLFKKTHLKKIPVFRSHVDNIIGLVHARRFWLHPGLPVSQLVVKVSFVPATANIERMLLQFRTRAAQMAVVVDEYGGTAGVVTLQDVLEEIVGSIPDPHEAASGPAVKKLGEGEYLIDANLAIHEWAEAFKTDLSIKRISTIGGFVTSLLGKIAQVGDSAVYRNLRFTVESIRGRRIAQLRLELLEGKS